MVATRTSTHNTRKMIIVFAVAILLYGVVAGFRATTGVFSTEISNATGLSYGTVSDVFAIRNFIFAVSCPLIGLLTQKIPLKYILISGATLATIGFIGTAFATEYITLLIFLGVMIGIGAGALCYAIVFAAAAPLLGHKMAAICAGILSASQGAFNILITPFIQNVGSTADGLMACFLVLGAITACLIPLCFIFRQEKNKDTELDIEEEGPGTSILAPLKFMATKPFFYMLAIGFITYGLCDGGMVNHLFEKATNLFDSPPKFASFLVMIYGFAIMVGPVIGGFIAAKVKNLRLCIAILFCIWLASSCTTFLVPLSNLSSIFIVLGMGLSISTFVPIICILIHEKVSIQNFASVFSILATFPILAYSFDAYFGGLCFDLFNNFALSTLLTFAMCVISIILFVITGLKYRKNSRN